MGVSSLGLPLDESNVRDSICVSSFDQDEAFEVSQSGPPKIGEISPPISIHSRACFRRNNFSALAEWESQDPIGLCHVHFVRPI